MVSNTLSSCMPNLASIPKVVVQPMSNNFLDKMSYLPVLSNVKAIGTLTLAIIAAATGSIATIVAGGFLLVGYVDKETPGILSFTALDKAKLPPSLCRSYL